MCFQIMHIVSKFQSFIHTFTVEKLKIKTKIKKKNREKGRVFSDFFKVTFLNEWTSYKLHIYIKVKLIILSITYVKIMWILKHVMCQNIKRVGSTFQVSKLIFG